MKFYECMEFIGSYSRLGGKVTDLSRAYELMGKLGNPQNKLKFIHIAGTNGKGSTLEYIATALELSGYKTGCFTSPYVTHYTDRIRINSAEIDEESLGRICGVIKEKVSAREYSQFEINMAIALLWFVQEKCDIVVFEAGIGGLLDCTNVIPPPVLSIITSVSLDHTAILGNTVEEIARQKAGIIKRGSCVILSADNSGSVMEIVRSTAEKVGAEFITPCKSQLKILSPDNTFRYRGEVYKTGMVGFHQIFNAVTSIEACNYLNENGFEIPSGNIHRAIENARVKARIQVIEGNPTVIVDGGHNPSGVDALADYLSEDNKKKYVIMGMVDSKDYIDCVKSISYLAENLFAVDGFASNCVPAEKIVEIAEGYTSAHTGTLKESFGKAVQLALENDGKVVICGSLYLASEFLNYSENIQIKN